jgi:hypothetical protein
MDLTVTAERTMRGMQKNKDEDADMIQEGNVNDQPSGKEYHNVRT